MSEYLKSPLFHDSYRELLRVNEYVDTALTNAQVLSQNDIFKLKTLREQMLSLLDDYRRYEGFEDFADTMDSVCDKIDGMLRIMTIRVLTESFFKDNHSVKEQLQITSTQAASKSRRSLMDLMNS